MQKQKGFTVVELMIVLIAVVSAVGWIWNIIKIIATVADPITGLFLVRCVGVIVAPLGVIVGYF